MDIDVHGKPGYSRRDPPNAGLSHDFQNLKVKDWFLLNARNKLRKSHNASIEAVSACS